MQDPKDFYKSETPRNLSQLLAYNVYAQQVRRFHTEPMLQPPNIGQHSGGVARLVLILTRGKASAALLAHCLHHDDGEEIMGDMPAPTKLALDNEERASYEAEEAAVIFYNVPFFKEVGQLNDNERRILKLADRLQGMLECVVERMLGNKFVIRPFERLCSYVCTIELQPYESQVYENILDLWRGACR